MAVSVASAFRFHMFDQARELDRQGYLGKLYTAVPKRLVREVGPGCVRSRVTRSGARYLVQKWSDRWDVAMNRLVIRDFDEWVLRESYDDDVLIALSSFATSALEELTRSGRIAICDRGSWHILEQKQVLTEEHDIWEMPAPRFDDWIVARELRDYCCSSGILVPSGEARASFLRQGVGGEKVATVPYGTDLTTFFAERRRSEASPLGSKRPFMVGSAGRVELQKGHQYLLRAMSMLPSRVRVEFAGPVNPSFTDRFGSELNGVMLCGKLTRPQLADRMRSWSVFVLASIHEGLPAVILQAMACGLPIIASRSTGAAEVMEDGVHGFIVPPRDSAAIADRIDTLLRDRDLREWMGMNASQRAMSDVSWHSYGERLTAALRGFNAV